MKSTFNYLNFKLSYNFKQFFRCNAIYEAKNSKDSEIANHKSKVGVYWPEFDRLIKGINKIMQTSWAAYFNAPVGKLI